MRGLLKFFKWLLIVGFVLILVVFIGAIIFIKTFDINKYKPQIAQQLSQSLGRGVEIGSLAFNLSLDQKIVLSVNGFKIADDPNFSTENFVDIKEIMLGVDTEALVSRRQILITTVEVDSPRISLIRNKDGLINAQSVAATAKKDQLPATTLAPTPSPENETANPIQNLPNEWQPQELMKTLLVKSIEIKGGRVKFVDRSFSPEISVDVSPVSVKVDSFSLTEPFSFSLLASLWSQAEVIRLNGRAQLDTRQLSAAVRNMTLDVDFNRMSLEQMKQSLAAIEVLRLVKELRGALELKADEISGGAKGLGKIKLQGALSGFRLAADPLASPVEAQKIVFHITENQIDIPEFTITVGQGKVLIRGKVDDYLGKQRYEFSKVVEGAEVAELISQKDQPSQVFGLLSANYNVTGKGFKYPELLDALEGQGNMGLKDGKITDINILKVVLDKISMIPDLWQKIEPNLPEKYKEKLKAKDTLLPKVTFNSGLRSGVIFLEDLVVESDTFSLRGHGECSLKGEVVAPAQLFVPKDLTDNLVASAEGLKFLIDESGRILIPVVVTGPINSLTVLPDFEYLAKKIVTSQLVPLLQGVIDKALDKEKPEEQPQPTEAGQGTQNQQQPSQVPQEEEKSSEQKLIEGIFDKIFK